MESVGYYNIIKELAKKVAKRILSNKGDSNRWLILIKYIFLLVTIYVDFNQDKILKIVY